MEIKSKFPAWKKKKKKFVIDKNGKKIKLKSGPPAVQNGHVNGIIRKTGGQDQKSIEVDVSSRKKLKMLKKNKKIIVDKRIHVNGNVQVKTTTTPTLSSSSSFSSKSLSIKSPSATSSVPATPTSSKKQQNPSKSPQISTNFEKFLRPQLPIDAVEQQLMLELVANDTLIVIGETGSGKSTQVPQLCIRARLAENGAIAVTEPRKVAAVSLATRVAVEMGTQIGETVGYHVRFENATSPRTKIEYMTDGIVLRKALISPLLDKYSVVIIDEAHERSLHSDVLMCILRKCQEQRNETKSPLKLIIMSATLQADKFKTYFNNAKVVTVAGRTFPIEMFHVNPKVDRSFSTTDYVYNTICCVKYVHLNEPKGRDILVFLSGSEEIESVGHQLSELNSVLPKEADVLLPVPLYAALRPEKQKEAFKKTPTHAVLCVSIELNHGNVKPRPLFSRENSKRTKIRFDASDRIDVLKVHSVSKAQAMQRAGRAGRDAPGKCYRLYSREEFQKFEAENMPEILRCNLSATFLELMKLGMKNPHKLKLIDPPETKNIDAALLELTSLGAIRPTNADRNKFSLTEMGDAFCMYPLPPDHARVLYQAQREGCIMEAIKIISAMQTDAIFSGNGSDSKNEADVERIRRKFETREGDHIGLLKLILTTNAFFDQLSRIPSACWKRA
uniref:RNA helicase n=1 Tax=Caenorhabditis japonica TaxID=281687 RepID=A0A8R1E3H5_CAEJA